MTVGSNLDGRLLRDKARDVNATSRRGFGALACSIFDATDDDDDDDDRTTFMLLPRLSTPHHSGCTSPLFLNQSSGFLKLPNVCLPWGANGKTQRLQMILWVHPRNHGQPSKPRERRVRKPELRPWSGPTTSILYVRSSCTGVVHWHLTGLVHQLFKVRAIPCTRVSLPIAIEHSIWSPIGVQGMLYLTSERLAQLNKSCS